MRTPLTRQQVHLVQSSFALVLSNADDAASRFYERLFTLRPSLRRLFADDMTAQKRALMATLEVVVAGLDRPDELMPVVRRLGARHVQYGVRACDYDPVGEALLWALDQVLGADFTPATRDAWGVAYDVLATTMKEAAREPAVPGGTRR